MTSSPAPSITLLHPPFAYITRSALSSLPPYSQVAADQKEAEEVKRTVSVEEQEVKVRALGGGRGGHESEGRGGALASRMRVSLLTNPNICKPFNVCLLACRLWPRVSRPWRMTPRRTWRRRCRR